MARAAAAPTAMPAIAPVEIGALEPALPVPSCVPCPVALPGGPAVAPVPVGVRGPSLVNVELLMSVKGVADVPLTPTWDAVVASWLLGTSTPSRSQTPAAPLVGITPM
jgi:hypothetical protein